MNRAAAFRPIALLLVLSVLLLGAAAPHASCEGSCCGAERGPGQAWAGESQDLSAPHACCCGPEAAPCDLEQAPPPDLPDSAVSTVPRVESPASLAVFVTPGSHGLARLAGRSPTPLSPSAQGQPPPLYLRDQAFLC